MMYHFMLGLRGGSLVAATPSAPDSCSPPAPASFFSSSCMIKLNSGLLFSFKLSGLLSSVAPEIAVQKRDAPLDHIVDDEKINAENKHRDHHHRGGAAHFLPRGRCDLAHLGAHVVVKRLGPLRPDLDPVEKTLTGGCDRLCHLLCLHCHTAPVLTVSQHPSKIWQGRRDSNPQVRFWRPTV